MQILTIAALVLIVVVGCNQMIGGGDRRHMFFLNNGPFLTTGLGAAAGLFCSIGLGWAALSVFGAIVCTGLIGLAVGVVLSVSGQKRLM